jgi:hypothetical protein
MICVERHIQKIRPGKWGELEAIDKKYNTFEINHINVLPS